jgi:hypothetical protein
VQLRGAIAGARGTVGAVAGGMRNIDRLDLAAVTGGCHNKQQMQQPPPQQAQDPGKSVSVEVSSGAGATSGLTNTLSGQPNVQTS